jgi:hypothetical protein
MNRELGEDFKLFLKSCNNCESVIWKRKRERRRRRIIREVKEQILKKILTICEGVYCDRLRTKKE